jgi:hypothetical protein
MVLALCILIQQGIAPSKSLWFISKVKTLHFLEMYELVHHLSKLLVTLLLVNGNTGSM